MRAILFLFLAAAWSHAAEPIPGIPDPDGTEKEKLDAIVKEIRDAERRAGFVGHVYKPTLMYAAGAAETSKQDPLAVAKTPEQRRFLREYYRVLHEEAETVRRDPTYLFMEPLRRCGVDFPKGARVVWMATNPPLLVVHTPAATKRIEKFMGLDAQK